MQILSVIFIIDCIALTVVVLMQEGKQQGLGGLFPEQQIHTGVRTKVVLWRVDLLKQPLLWQCYFLYWQQLNMLF